MKFSDYILEQFESDEYHKFDSTFYRPPTDEEMQKIHESGLTGDDILKGLTYTMVGRGMFDAEKKKEIRSILENFVSKFPEDKKYQIALNKLDAMEVWKRK